MSTAGGALTPCLEGLILETARQTYRGGSGRCADERKHARHSLGGKVDWRFTTDDARIKLKRLYPSTDE